MYIKFSKIFPKKKCTDLQMNKEHFDFIALSYQLPMQEGRLEDIGTTHLLFTVDN